ncbi:MAG: hypothetical protein ACTSPI_00280 [Candidatus Heimdallarchaeaceae archaeon]
MKETKIYHKMRDKLSGKGMLLQRIEMDHVPDIFYRTWHQDGWIELKTLKSYPIRKTYVEVPFRPGQMNWIKTYCSLKGNMFLFFYIENSLWIFKKMNIKERYYINEIKKFSCYNALWKEVDWDNIYNLLDNQPGIINLR